jgi:class 3 adenylate cyclase
MGLPSGTVTFAFTDIEGSTALLKALGERYGDLLGDHRRIIREQFGAANGIEIDTQGDAFFYAFPRARDAVLAAVEVQRAHADADWPEGAPVRVRIGLHTGEPVVGEEGYLGLDVVRAARICTAAQGGDVLLSETTRALAGSALPDGVSIFPRGERQLKGIDEPERIYELAIEGAELDVVEKPDREAKRARRPGREQEFERRLEDFGERLAASIQERVLGSLERRLPSSGGADASPAADPEESAAIEEMSARASRRSDEIAARVEEALARKRRGSSEPR